MEAKMVQKWFNSDVYIRLAPDFKGSKQTALYKSLSMWCVKNLLCYHPYFGTETLGIRSGP